MNIFICNGSNDLRNPPPSTEHEKNTQYMIFLREKNLHSQVYENKREVKVTFLWNNTDIY